MFMASAKLKEGFLRRETTDDTESSSEPLHVLVDETATTEHPLFQLPHLPFLHGYNVISHKSEQNPWLIHCTVTGLG